MAQLIAITASQAGPAHSYMLGEALQAAAATLGHTLKLKVVSRLGTQGGYTAADVASAQAVIVAADMAIDRSDLPAERVIDTSPEAVFKDPAEVVRLALQRLGMLPVPGATGASTAQQAAAHAASASASVPFKIVAITSCPTGVAHTFMAAEALEQGALALGHAIRVETQGSVGAQNALTPAEIAAADLVIIAADTQVDRARFAGKRLFATSTKAAIRDAGQLIAQARAAATPWGDAAAASPGHSASDATASSAAPTAGP